MWEMEGEACKETGGEDGNFSGTGGAALVEDANISFSGILKNSAFAVNNVFKDIHIQNEATPARLESGWELLLLSYLALSERFSIKCISIQANPAACTSLILAPRTSLPESRQQE